MLATRSRLRRIGERVTLSELGLHRVPRCSIWISLVIGGGLVQSGDLLMVPIKQAFEEHAGMTFVKRLKIVPAELDQEAGVVGAAALFADGDRYWSPATTGTTAQKRARGDGHDTIQHGGIDTRCARFLSRT